MVPKPPCQVETGQGGSRPRRAGRSNLEDRGAHSCPCQQVEKQIKMSKKISVALLVASVFNSVEVA